MRRSKSIMRNNLLKRLLTALLSLLLLLMGAPYGRRVSARETAALRGIADDGLSVILSRDDSALIDGDTIFSTDELDICFDFNVTGMNADAVRQLTENGSIAYSVDIDLPAGLVWRGGGETELYANDSQGVRRKYGSFSVVNAAAVLTFAGDFWIAGTEEPTGAGEEPGSETGPEGEEEPEAGEDPEGAENPGGWGNPAPKEDLFGAYISGLCMLDMEHIGTNTDYMLRFIDGSALNLIIGDNIETEEQNNNRNIVDDDLKLVGGDDESGGDDEPGDEGDDLYSVGEGGDQIFGAMAFGEDQPSQFTVYSSLDDFVDDPPGLSIIIKKDDVPLQAGETVAFDDDLVLEYDFSITGQLADNIRLLLNYNASNIYTVTIPVPEGIELIYDAEAATGKAMIDDAGLTWGMLYVIDGVATLQFTGDFWSDPSLPYLNSAFILISCALDEDEIGDEAEYLFHFTDGSTLNLVIEGNGTPPMLDKSGMYYSGAQEFEWTINYTKGSVLTSELPITIVDTFDNTEQRYVGPFTASPDVVGTLVVDDTSEPGKTTITYTMYAAPTTDVVFTYRTAITADAFNSANYNQDTTVGNEADLVSNNGVSFLATPATGTVTVPPDDKKWIEKFSLDGSSYSYDDVSKTYYDYVSDRVLNWEVVVTTYDFGLTDLWLYDKIPAGQSLVAGSIYVDGDLFVSTGSNYVPATQGNDNTFGIALPQYGSGYEKTYVITYSTKIDDETLYNSDSLNGFTIQNEAWLVIEWDSDAPAPEPHYTVGIGVDNHIIQKSGVYDSVNKEITWTVTVNPNGLYVEDGTITEDLTKVAGDVGNLTPSDSYLTYVGGSFSVTRGVKGTDLALVSPTPDDETADGETELEIEVGEIGTRTVAFTFKTKVTDEYYDHNHSNLANTIDFDGTVVIDSNSMEVDDTATAVVPCVSTVLSKYATGYDYDDNAISWKIELNRNESDLGEVTLTDTVVAPQTFDKVSVEVRDSTGTLISSPGDYTVAFTDSDRTMTITINDVDEKTTVTYRTLVDVSAVTAFNISSSNAAVNFNNTVTMVQEDGRTDTSYATQYVRNQVLGKNYVTNKDNGGHDKVSYSINVDLNRASFTNGVDCKLTDKIPTGMKLDIDTVKLYFAKEYDTTNNAGTSTYNYTTYKIEKDPDNEAKYGADKDYTWTYESIGNALSVIVNAPGRYVLEYDCYVADARITSFSNQVDLTGTSVTGNTLKSANKNVTVTGGGAISAGTVASLTLTKQDADTKSALASATFELWTNLNGTPVLVQTATTNASGQLTFYPLRAGRTYWIVEKTAASGYDSSTAIVNTENNQQIVAQWLSDYMFTVTAGIPKSITVTNQKTPGENPVGGWPSIKITKTNESGTPLPGAEFVLKRGSAQSTIPLTRDADGYTFTSGGLTAGTYTLTETKAPDNYQLLQGDSVIFEVKDDGTITTVNKSALAKMRKGRDGNIYEITVADPPTVLTLSLQKYFANFGDLYGPTLWVKKTDENGNALEGAQFELKKDDGRVIPLTIEGGSFFTVSDLEAGIYTLKETKAPSGYQAINNVLTFKVEIDDGVTEAKITYISGSANLIQVGDTHIAEAVVANKPKNSANPGFPRNRNPRITGYWPTVPVEPGVILIPTDDGGYIELDANGNAIGKWIFNERTWEWIFESYYYGTHGSDGPLAQTGVGYTLPVIIIIAILGLILILSARLLEIRRRVGKRNVYDDG